MQLQKETEEALVKNIHLCWNSNQIDTILLNIDFLRRVDRVIDILNIISHNSIFSRDTNYPLKDSGNSNGQNAGWFDPYTYNTFSAWLVHHFEEIIREKFLKQHKYLKMTTSLSIVNYECYIKLQAFWLRQFKSKKLGMISSLENDLKILKGSESKGGSKKNSQQHQ